MVERTRIRIDETGEWARCGRCRRKLFRIRKNPSATDYAVNIEVKCHSCKAVNVIDMWEEMPENQGG